MKRNIKLLIILLLIVPWMISLKNGEVTEVDNFNLNLPRVSSTSLTGDLNYRSEDDYIFESLTWSGESLFNVTCSSTGSADLFFYFTSTINRYSYYNNKDALVWSDDFLTTYGKPSWGANWNKWTLNDDIDSGVEVIAGNRKSFLLSLGNGDSFDVRIYILLKQTTNSSDNSYKIDIVNLLDSNIIESIEIGNQNTTHFSVPTKGFKLFKFESSITSNEVVLSNEIIVNDSFSWIYWHDTLTNIWIPSEESFTENISRDWVPIFNNFDLTGRSALGIIFNSAGTDLNFTYSSRLALDSNNRTEKIIYSGTSMFSTNFLLNDTIPDAYFILEVNDGCFFDTHFQVDLNWSVSVDFYSLGTNHGQKFVIDNQGINGDEKLSMLYTPTSNIYQDKDTAAFIEQESYGDGWYVINGSLKPEVKKIEKISSLIGFHINANNNGINPDVNITVQVIPRDITNFSSGEDVGIGKTNAGLETPTFPFLQVRQFDTVNWRRYQWELQAYNQTKLIEDSFWFCGVEGDEYENNMNNSLYSPQINNTNNYVDLTLEVKISCELSPIGMGNDEFSIYIKNDTDTEFLAGYIEDSEGEITYSVDISKWIGWNFTIEFNLCTNSMGTDNGITVDDFMIKGNSSLIIYENDFESNIAGWTHIDHSGEGDLWHIVTEEVGFNKPIVDVVYQESTYSMVGEKPSLIGIGASPRIFFDKDPKAQPILRSYLVYYAEGPIEANFSIKLSVNSFDLVSITDNQIKFTNNFTYEEAEQQGAEVINSTKVLNRPRWYYKINVVDLHQLIIELSENSILQEHDSISIAFYDQYGQSPFTVSCLETNALYLGLNLLGQVRSSGAVIISITDLTYNDYIELNIYDNPYDTNSPTVDFELGTQSIPLRMVNDQIKFNFSISDTGGRSINIESLKFYLVEGLDSIADWNDSRLKEISPTYNITLDTGQNVKLEVLISNTTLSADKYYQLLIYIEDTESPSNINSPNDASIVIIGPTISKEMDLDPIIIIILLITLIAFGALGFIIYRKYSKLSKKYSSLKIHYDVMAKNLKMKPPLDTENANKPPFSPPIDSNNKHETSDRTFSTD